MFEVSSNIASSPLGRTLGFWLLALIIDQTDKPRAKRRCEEIQSLGQGHPFSYGFLAFYMVGYGEEVSPSPWSFSFIFQPFPFNLSPFL